MDPFQPTSSLRLLPGVRGRWFLLLCLLAGLSLAATGGFALFPPVRAADSFVMTGHTPATNAVGVAVGQSISADFDAALAASTVTSRTFTVRSSLRGLFTESATVTGSSLTLDPSRDFFAGEQVQVVGSAAISSTGGAALTPVQWGFTAGPVMSRCVAPFADSGAFDNALPAVRESSVAWADYDGDGRLDILLTGNTLSGPVTQVYRNTPAGFVDSGATIPGIYRSSAAWGDFDNDGRPDLLLTGLRNTTPGAAILRNNGSTFVGVGAADNALLPVYRGSVDWGDYDNDGDLDILLTGLGDSFVAKVYRNDGGVFVDSGPADDALVGVVTGSVAWGDYDNDGDLDILLTGDRQNGGGLATVYRNDNGLFVESGAADDALAAVSRSSVAWGDYDNDGDLDILLTGQGQNGPVAQLYRNDGGVFVESGAADDALVGVAKGSVAWGDYDNDGDLDILLTGDTQGGAGLAKLYRNDSGVFVESGNIDDALIGVYDGSAAWGDYDNDGKLDILLTGQSSSGPVTKIYHNEECAGGTATPTPTATATPPTPTATPTATATPGPPSDGNGDGIPDLIQPNVQSVLSSAGHYVTLAGPNGATLANTGAQTPTLPPPLGVELAQGLIGFTANGLSADSGISVTLTIHSGPAATSYWKFGPTGDNSSPHWYEFVYDGETGALVNGRQVVLHFVDGKRGDSDLLANGSITDPGGPGGVVVDEFIFLPAISRK